ncbi:uncharacterized protein VTP21DRAFT_8272 [Calcarisporiella thermophila]|uniref:uncharacterized protein n=1 Tax=Calcarisporiella thermophila TaxID=911321 RepID=UPI003744483F
MRSEENVPLPAAEPQPTQEFSEEKDNIAVAEKGEAEDGVSKEYPLDSLYGWFVVVAAFFLTFYLFGLATGWGVFQDLYSKDILHDQESLLSISYIGSLSIGLMYVFGLISGMINNRFGNRSLLLAATVIQPLGLILASFSSTLWQLYLTQGLLVGLGNGCAFHGGISIIPQWFERYRGLATGIAVSGSGFGGLALAPLSRALIDRLGYRWALRILGIIGFATLLSSFFIVRPRASRPSHKPSIIHLSFFDMRFAIVMVIGLFAMLGYWQPYFMLPSYAVATTGLTPQLTAIFVGVISGVASVFRIVLGGCADWLGYTNVLMGSLLLSTISILIFWVFAKSFAFFVIFVILFGASSGGFTSLFPVIVTELVKPEDTPTAMGLAYFSFGVGSLLGPGFSVLLKASNGGDLGSILFAGSVSLVATIAALGLRYLKSHRILAKV